MRKKINKQRIINGKKVKKLLKVDFWEKKT